MNIIITPEFISKYREFIALYSYIYECYNTQLCWHCQRFSNNTPPDFTDEELLTVYIFCIAKEEKFRVKSIYTYACKYLYSWFPKLPSYQAFCNRLNRLAAVFLVLVSYLLEEVNQDGINVQISLLDSMPIIICSGKRAGKVALR